MCDWLREFEWNLKLFESWMRGNEMTFPKLSLCISIPMNSNSFHHKTLEWRWYDFFHLKKWKGVWKWFEFHLKYVKFRNVKQLNEFMREDKMTSSYLKKESWKFQRNKMQVTLKLFETHSSIRSCLKFQIQIQLGVIWVSF